MRRLVRDWEMAWARRFGEEGVRRGFEGEGSAMVGGEVGGRGGGRDGGTEGGRTGDLGAATAAAGEPLAGGGGRGGCEGERGMGFRFG